MTVCRREVSTTILIQLSRQIAVDFKADANLDKQWRIPEHGRSPYRYSVRICTHIGTRKV
jgi:hypothetical protein